MTGIRNCATGTGFAFMAMLACGAPLPAQAGDWLDIEAVPPRLLQGTTSYSEGATVRFVCDWMLDFADDHSYWNAKTTQRFPIRMEVDTQFVGEDQVVIPQGTTLQKPDGGFSSGLKGSSRVVSWVAKGAGKHRLFCIVNKPKGMSDQYSGNNEKYLEISVAPAATTTPAAPALLPLHPAGPALQSRHPASAQDTGRSPPAAASRLPARPVGPGNGTAPPPPDPRQGTTLRGATAISPALNPQAEVPSVKRGSTISPAPDLQPEVPKPDPTAPGQRLAPQSAPVLR